MDFKQTFEKHVNKELGEQSDPPSAIDVEVPQDPPPVHSFPSYPPQPYIPPPRRSGMYVPTPIFVLFILLFLFESSVLFVYTVVALYNTLPASFMPVQQPPHCDCPATNEHAPINVAPNIWLPAAAMTTVQTTQHEVTITVTADLSTAPSSRGGSGVVTNTQTSSTLSSSTVVSSAVEASDAAIGALISAITHRESNGAVTVTAPVPTMTVLSTASEVLPSITTMTVLSTAAPLPQSTVTSVATITA
ncbi:hypothetical protein MBLNU459_g3434t1 [Dothideomycetes sp. NU459]